MAQNLKIRCEAKDMEVVEGTTGTAYTQGQTVALVTGVTGTGVHGFALETYLSTEKPVFAISARRVLAAVSSATYAVGTRLYDDPTTPGSAFNTTSASRKFVGVVAKNYASAVTEVEMIYMGDA